MAKTSGGVRSERNSHTGNRSQRNYYEESKRLRKETLAMAEPLKNNPLYFSIRKGISMDVEVTKSDIKTIVGKNTKDSKFNAIRNKLAQNIKGFIQEGKYEEWRDVIPGKHEETAYFAYYSRELGAKAYLCMRKMKDTGKFKPYAIINDSSFASSTCRSQIVKLSDMSHLV